MKKFLATILILLWAGPAFAIGAAGEGDSTTRAQLITEVYYEVAGYTTTPNKAFDSAMVENRINAAMRDIAFQYACVERWDTIPVTASTEWYALNNDFYRVRGVIAWGKTAKINNSAGLTEITHDQIGKHRDASGIPAVYLIDNDKIHLEPANVTSDTVLIMYAAKSTNDTTNANLINIPKEYVTLIILTASEYLLRGKLPMLSTVDAAKLADIQSRKAIEEARLARANQSITEQLTGQPNVIK